MTLRRLRFLPFMLLAVFAGAGAAAENAPLGKFDVVVELPADAPYVGEPLRLVLRSAIRARVASDRIEQPALTDFDWRQFGVDASSEELIDGFWAPAVTRALMIYPLRAGRLTIESFKRRVTYFNSDGDRVETELVSRPLTIDVRARDGVGDAADFWLPAKSLRIIDRWEPEPDKIRFGEAARRTVVVEADGVPADRLPPMPNFRAPGVITFAGPVERQTIVTDLGPVGRAVYRWMVRPVTATPAVAPAIRLPWFDIATRTMRVAEAPERRVAYLDAISEPKSTEAGEAFGLFSARPLIAALLAFVSTAAACFLVSTQGARSGWLRFVAKNWRQLFALRVAGRKGDVAAFRVSLRALSNSDPELWRRVAASDDIAPALASIDAAIFAREAPSAPALTPLAQKIAAALRRAAAQGCKS
jgi:hypothetical protein